jgi:hypothetical protein
MDYQKPPFQGWQDVLDAPRSAFFRGHTTDWVAEKQSKTTLGPNVEAMLTQSNARVLLGQAANGSLRMVALPTCVYPAPTQTGEFGLGPGMYHHFDVAMYAGDLAYHIQLDNFDRPIVLDADERQNESWYADDFIPLTHTQEGALDITLVGFAPVAADVKTAPLKPAPLPGPAGALYVMVLHNQGTEPLNGKVLLMAGDLLVGHYEDASPQMREFKHPDIDLRQHTLILTRPEGSVGIHLHQGRWTQLEAPFQAERTFQLGPGEELCIETHLALGQNHSQVMQEIYALHMHSALEWLNRTAAFWRERLGTLTVEAAQAHEEAQISRDIYIRSLLDNFNCLQTDANGNLNAHWQGAPSHGYGTVWGIDVEPTAVSVVHICPEITWRVLLFFMTRSRAPKGPPDHSIPILVAPVIIARQWLQVTGELQAFSDYPDVLPALESIMQDLLALESPSAPLFPTRYSSDGVVGRRYDYGTNVKVWYTFDSMAYILRLLGYRERAELYQQKAAGIRAAIYQTMVVEGPFGPQISGGANLEYDPGTFYLPEGVLYYDGEDTSSMLAPIYGLCNFDDQPWINYHRFARSLWHAGFDPEFETLYWHPSEPGVFDGTAYFSILGGCVTEQEMQETLQAMRDIVIDDVTGSVFWWPHGLEFKRSLTRCSQGQGAFAWQYLYQWLGLKVDSDQRLLILAPRGLPTEFTWNGFRAGPSQFSVEWHETQSGTFARIRNENKLPWKISVGFRPLNTGASHSLAWQSCTLAPGEASSLFQPSIPIQTADPGLTQARLIQLEVQAFGDQDGVLFKRFGPALLWGHWDPQFAWDWSAMPLALRFVVENATQSEWKSLTIKLTCPEGWIAQGRRTRHWDQPEDMRPGTIALQLGSLAANSRTVAAYWIKAEQDFTLRIRWDDARIPFHAPSQPGVGLTLRTADIPSQQVFNFQAEMIAQSKEGRTIQKKITVPVTILPYKS